MTFIIINFNINYLIINIKPKRGYINNKYLLSPNNSRKLIKSYKTWGRRKHNTEERKGIAV